MNIKDNLFALSESFGVGSIKEASDKACELLSEYAECERLGGLTIVGTLRGESDYTLMLDAHIDEVAMIVTDVDENGFVTVAKCGGIDLRILPARSVVIHGKRQVKAVFCSTPPHLSSGEIEYTDISALKLDTMLGSKASEIVSVGDYVTFCTKPVELLENRVSGKSFDDRAGVVCLLELAKRLSGKKLPFNIAFLLSDAEELQMRGCKTASYTLSPNEAIAIDVSFADAPDISANECGKLGGGAMIGVSPVLDKEISEKLEDLAREKNIPYQLEVMGGKTGTNGDVISISRSGVKTGLVSIPLRNMHTDCELLDLNDISSVCDILEAYILAGGMKNA